MQYVVREIDARFEQAGRNKFECLAVATQKISAMNPEGFNAVPFHELFTG